jgi:hypothetical protein
MQDPDNAMNGRLQIRIRVIFKKKDWICIRVSWIRIRIKIQKISRRKTEPWMAVDSHNETHHFDEEQDPDRH